MTETRKQMEARHAAERAALEAQETLLTEARSIAYETRRNRPGCAGYADSASHDHT
jgi:hypothetical protein